MVFLFGRDGLKPASNLLPVGLGCLSLPGARCCSCSGSGVTPDCAQSWLQPALATATKTKPGRLRVIPGTSPTETCGSSAEPSAPFYTQTSPQGAEIRMGKVLHKLTNAALK